MVLLLLLCGAGELVLDGPVTVDVLDLEISVDEAVEMDCLFLHQQLQPSSALRAITDAMQQNIQAGDITHHEVPVNTDELAIPLAGEDMRATVPRDKSARTSRFPRTSESPEALLDETFVRCPAAATVCA
jgi:hypothetical protein